MTPRCVRARLWTVVDHLTNRPTTCVDVGYHAPIDGSVISRLTTLARLVLVNSLSLVLKLTKLTALPIRLRVQGEGTIPQHLLRKYIMYARNNVRPQLHNIDQDKVSTRTLIGGSCLANFVCH